MDTFSEFVWPVPLAFAAAVSACRFEQGDVLYPSAEGYAAFDPESAAEVRAIQVLSPPRSARLTSTAGGEGSRRQQNWESEVEFAWSDLRAGTQASSVTTQGKLFMALWQGEESWLDPDRAQPDLPRGARELHSELQAAADFLREGKAASRKSSVEGARFVFGVDLSSDASVSKGRLIQEGLAKRGPVEMREDRPESVGIEGDRPFHPAVMVRSIRIPGQTVEAVEEALRAMLYVGGAGTTAPDEPESGEGRSGRFSVSRHGVLEAL